MVYDNILYDKSHVALILYVCDLHFLTFYNTASDIKADIIDEIEKDIHDYEERRDRGEGKLINKRLYC